MKVNTYSQMTHQLFFLACLHDNSNSGDKISRLLSDLCRLVVQPPENGTTNLRQVGLHPLTQTVDNSSETVQHDNVLCCLFLKL